LDDDRRTYILNRQHALGGGQEGGALVEEDANGLGHVALLQVLQHLVLVLEQESRKQLDQLLAPQVVDPLDDAGQQQLAPEHRVPVEGIWKRAIRRRTRERDEGGHGALWRSDRHYHRAFRKWDGSLGVTPFPHHRRK